MKDKIIAAALTEMEIHSLRFTMEDLMPSARKKFWRTRTTPTRRLKKFCNWQGWQDFHRRMIHTVIELIKIGTDEGLYRNVNLSVVEEIGLIRLEGTINIAAPTGGFFVAAMNERIYPGMRFKLLR